MQNQYRLGIDAGGTFTDFILADRKGGVRIFKALSTPNDPTAAIRNARRLRSNQRCRHRSTSTNLSGVRATNASIAATPSAAPGHDHATSRPNTTGSAVRLQPPCSVGIAT